MPMTVDTNMPHVYSKQPHPRNGHLYQYGKKGRNSRHVEFKSHLPHYNKSIILPILLREIASHIQNITA